MKDLATEPAVYGVVLVAGLVVVSGESTEAPLDVLVKVAATVVVFWAAHVYAGVIARLGDEHQPGVRVRTRLASALRRALDHSWGILGAVVVPLLVLLLGVVDVLTHSQAVWGTLWVSVLLLGVLGYYKVANWAGRGWVRLASAAATSTLGLALILLKTFVH